MAGAVWKGKVRRRKHVKLDGRPYTIIGVMPPGFRYPIFVRNAIYRPLVVPKELSTKRGSHWLPSIARLKPGASMQTAQADMDRLMASQAQEFSDLKGRRMQLRDISSVTVGQASAPLMVLLMAVFAVLAIGCVNVAGLLMARGVKREREMAVRSALGASRSQMVRQLLTETTLIAVTGAAIGIVLSVLLLDSVRSLLISALNRGMEVEVNIPVLIATIAVAFLTASLAGLLPSVRLSRVDPGFAMKVGGNAAGSSRSQHRLRAGFIVTQVALALTLLVTSAVLLRTLSGLRNADLGFESETLITEQIDVSPSVYEGRDLRKALFEPLLEKVRAVPGVKDAGLINVLPIQTWGWNSDVQIVGKPPAPPNQEQLAEVRATTPGYFSTLGIRLVRGRFLDPNIDTETSEPTVVVNEAFVHKFFSPGEDPIGQYIDDKPKARIVGVVSSVRQSIDRPSMAEMDFLTSQLPQKSANQNLTQMFMVIRSNLPLGSIDPGLREAFHQVDPGLPFRKPETMTEVVSDVLIFERLENWMFGTFAGLAIVLALIGIYGLISHEIELSTRDIGVRLALGATRGVVFVGVYRRVLIILAIGVATGLFITAAVHRVVASVVVVHVAKDAGLIAAIAFGIVVAGVLAAAVPAKRATSIEPMNALRYE